VSYVIESVSAKNAVGTAPHRASAGRQA